MIKKTLNKQALFGLLAGVILTSIIGFGLYSANAQKEKSSWLPVKDIEEKATAYINSELIQQGEATVKVAGKEGNMYKLEVEYNGQKIPSLISKDGQKFFPQVLDLSGKEAVAENTNETKTDAQPVVDSVEKKSDKPEIELFVMSHCPYGLQMEKGIIPAIKALGNKVDFKIKFNDYAMHGEKELKEQLNQYCIQKEQPDKYLAYLECFAKNGDSGAEGCLNNAQIDKGKVAVCVAKTEQEYKVMANFNNKIGYKGSYAGFEIFKADNEKYSVGGSPTLVINGSESNSGRDSKSLLKSICSAFNNPPKECSTELSSESPTPGFGGGSAPSNGTGGGGCGQ